MMLIVKNTFITVVAADTAAGGSARRTRSAPAEAKFSSPWKSHQDTNTATSDVGIEEMPHRLLHAPSSQPHASACSFPVQVEDVAVEHQKPLPMPVRAGLVESGSWGHTSAWSAPLKEGVATSEDGETESTSASAGTHPDSLQERPSRQKRNRHCKNKRDRYHRLVARLTDLAATDHGAFLKEMATLPISIASCEKSTAMLLTTLQNIMQIPLLA
mmetsp:Transcript_82090/g.235833  ORF Transcript_82090/g.235833 Transcript_82090/m.235833 type:complete len:215 (+) Transcript_82090:64-708(+)